MAEIWSYGETSCSVQVKFYIHINFNKITISLCFSIHVEEMSKVAVLLMTLAFELESASVICEKEHGFSG
jgi:hypothetical protein